MKHERGVTLVEMMIVVAIAGTMVSLVLPVFSNGLENLRLSQASDSVAAFINGALNRAERRQQAMEVTISPRENLILLRSADGDDDALAPFNLEADFSTLAHVDADGSFEWKNVPAGHYFVQISEASGMPDWFLKSVAAAGREVAESGFSVSGGVTKLDLVASANGAGAEGVVSNGKDEPVPDAVVVAVPEARWRTHPERYRKAVADQVGRFVLRGLTPGEYILFAWESVDGEAYYNPEFLKSYEGQGKALHFSEGERKSLRIRAVPAAEEEARPD